MFTIIPYQQSYLINQGQRVTKKSHQTPLLKSKTKRSLRYTIELTVENATINEPVNLYLSAYPSQACFLSTFV